MRQDIERAIRTTLVVLNKRSIGVAVDKIEQAVRGETDLEGFVDDHLGFGIEFESLVTSCCKVGPITYENYCPNCGKKIKRL